MTHRVIGVAVAHQTGCATCGPSTPHQVIARCACGQTATGMTDHIWTLTRDGDRATFSPSFNWLVDPQDPSKGSHLHEFLNGVPILNLSALFGHRGGGMIEELSERSYRAINKLAKWRSVFAGWQLGTRSRADGETRAVKDHREVTMLLRAEVNALTGLLIRKGVFTAEEFTEQLIAEAIHLDAEYEKRFPGFSTEMDEATGDEGVHMEMPLAGETMREMGFPP